MHPSTQTRFKSLRFLSTLTALLLAGDIGLTFLIAFVPESAFDGMENQWGSLLTAGLLALAVFVGTSVSFVVWLFRAAKNARVIRPDHIFEHQPSATIGWWFVPFANLFKPFRVVREIWFASEVDRSEPGGDRENWAIARAPQLLQVWWGLWIARLVMDRLSGKVDAFAVDVMWSLTNTAAAIACILVVRALTKRQHDAFAEMNPTGPTMRDGIGHVAETR